MKKSGIAAVAGNSSSVVTENRSRGEMLFLVFTLIATLVFNGYCVRFYDVMSADGTGYATSGKLFFETMDPRHFGTTFPPLYPFLIGLLNLVVHDLESSARFVSVIFNSITIVPLYLLGREYSKKEAIGAVLLYATLPFIHGMSGIDITEPTYTFLALSGAWFFWKAYRDSKLLRFIVSGGFCGLAYLARPEGFIVAFFLSGCLLLALLIDRSMSWQSLRRIGLYFFGFLAGFFFFAFPSVTYLHGVTGKWQLSGKTVLNTNIIREYRGFAPPDQHLRIGGADGSGNVETLADLMKHEPELFWLNLRENLKELPKAFTSVFPAYFWLFVAFGVAAGRWSRDRIIREAILAALCAPLFLYIFYFIQPRGFYAYIPILLIWVAHGGTALETMISKRPFWRNIRIPVVLPAIALLSLYYFYMDIPKPKPPYEYTQDGGRYDDKQVGIKLRSIIPEQAKIMTRSGRIAFYSQRSYVLPPQGTFEEIINFARQNNVNYLIATVVLMNMRPQLQSLFLPITEPNATFVPPFGLELVHIGQEPGGLPYIIYRLR